MQTSCVPDLNALKRGSGLMVQVNQFNGSAQVEAEFEIWIYWPCPGEVDMG